MPLYEYACQACEARFERLQPMTAGHDADCPGCGREAHRILSVFAAPVSVGVGAGAAPSGPLSNACCGGGCGCG